jgi:hypothetical protein
MTASAPLAGTLDFRHDRQMHTQNPIASKRITCSASGAVMNAFGGTEGGVRLSTNSISIIRIIKGR